MNEVYNSIYQFTLLSTSRIAGSEKERSAHDVYNILPISSIVPMVPSLVKHRKKACTVKLHVKCGG